MTTSNFTKADIFGAVCIRPLSLIQEEPVRWLWQDFIPAGMLTLLAGAGGCGKSTLAFDLAATVSKGGLLPDGSRASLGNVLIWSSEDSFEHTIKPRLMAAGANLEAIAKIEGPADDYGNTTAFDPARNLDDLVWRLRELRSKGKQVDLLIIDPIVSVIAGNMHRANDVRTGMQPLINLADELDCAIIGITHLAKNTAGRNSIDRVIGSQAFSAVARLVLFAAKDEDSDRRVLTRAKSNISTDGDGYEYSIEAVTLPGDIHATRVVWGEAVTAARNILSDVEGEDAPNANSKSEHASAFLCRILADGPLPAVAVATMSLKQGIAPATLRRAREKLRIKPEKGIGDMRSGWVWVLPAS